MSHQGILNYVDPYITRLKTQITKFGFDTECVGLDAGYNTNIICRDLSNMGIRELWVTGRGCQPKGKYGKYKFKYLPEWDVYVCPERCYLMYTNNYKDRISGIYSKGKLLQ